ncbi:MAG: hypothetical protein PVH84_17240 [Candidatus Aminicenantes bacterium]
MGHLIQLDRLKMFSLRNLDNSITEMTAVVLAIKGGFGCYG